MKTAVTVLQEMMVKLAQTPDYECISQSGPQHQAMFEYRCAALGAVVTASARSKKEAKQEAARLMLRRLAGLGHAVPPPYACPAQPQNDNVSIPKGIRVLSAPTVSPAAARKRPACAYETQCAQTQTHSPGKRPREGTPPAGALGAGAGAAGAGAGAAGAGAGVGAAGAGVGAEGASAAGAGEAGGGGGARSYVALLKELCEEYRLPGAEYELVGDTGPPHLRHFTISARVGHLARAATATTKKAARQLAAHQLYAYLRENLARLTHDFVEEDALVRAHEKAMERYLETRDEARRPDLGQRVADYHLGLTCRLEPEAWDAALRALEGDGDDGEGGKGKGLDAALAAMGLSARTAALEPLHVLALDGAAPPLAFAGADAQRARAAAARYVRRALARRPPAPPPRAAAASPASPARHAGAS